MKLAHYTPPGNLDFGLFASADRRQHVQHSLAAKRLSRRFRLPPATAQAVSELAYGIGGAR
jgi:hypothetical protein